jgi:hypothetical protein
MPAPAFGRAIKTALLAQRTAEPAYQGGTTITYNMTMTDTVQKLKRETQFCALEREWRVEFGLHLLDRPHEAVGSAEVFSAQFERIVDDY